MIPFMSGLSVQTKIFLIAALFVAGFLIGWQTHGWKTDASLYRGIAKQEKTRQIDTAKAGKIIEKAETEKERQKIVYRNIYHKIQDLKNADDVCFTADSLKLWNDAISGKDSDRKVADDAPAADDTIDRQDPVATVEQVLQNAAENYQTCNENSIKHNALIDRLEQLDGKMCYCQE